MPVGFYNATPPRVPEALSQTMQPTRHVLERMTAAEIAGALVARLRLPAYNALLPKLRAALDDPDVLMASAAVSLSAMRLV